VGVQDQEGREGHDDQVQGAVGGAQLVQQEGINYDDAFTIVARMELVGVLLVLAAQEGWQVYHMDVKSTFLNGNLKEEVYMRQPPGFTVAKEEGKVYHLCKVLYGLRQALRT
jgi:hypothetical protein